MYRVYSGPPGTPKACRRWREKLLFKQFGSLDEAMSWARRVRKDGRVPLRIEGDDGTSLSKYEIAAALAHGTRYDSGRSV